MGAPKAPTPPSIPQAPLAAHPYTLGSSASALAGSLEKQRAYQAEGKGMDKTVLTSPEGLTPPNTSKTTLT